MEEGGGGCFVGLFYFTVTLRLNLSESYPWSPVGPSNFGLTGPKARRALCRISEKKLFSKCHGSLNLTYCLSWRCKRWGPRFLFCLSYLVPPPTHSSFTDCDSGLCLFSLTLFSTVSFTSLQGSCHVGVPDSVGMSYKREPCRAHNSREMPRDKSG
jgi:hypothetical protein